MIYCNGCENFYIDPALAKDGGGDVGEDWEVCPNCGHDDIEDVERCSICGVWMRPAEQSVHTNAHMACIAKAAKTAHDVLTKVLTEQEYSALRDYFGDINFTEQIK